MCHPQPGGRGARHQGPEHVELGRYHLVPEQAGPEEPALAPGVHLADRRGNEFRIFEL